MPLTEGKGEEKGLKEGEGDGRDRRLLSRVMSLIIRLSTAPGSVETPYSKGTGGLSRASPPGKGQSRSRSNSNSRTSREKSKSSPSSISSSTVPNITPQTPLVDVRVADVVENSCFKTEISSKVTSAIQSALQAGDILNVRRGCIRLSDSYAPTPDVLELLEGDSTYNTSGNIGILGNFGTDSDVDMGGNGAGAGAGVGSNGNSNSNSQISPQSHVSEQSSRTSGRKRSAPKWQLQSGKSMSMSTSTSTSKIDD